MNSVERQIYCKYAYNKTFSYIWRVYAEFEIRVNYSPEEYEGIKTGECRFDYNSWENRLDISHKQMVRAIKELIENDKVIKQISKGTKGNASIYFLNRFDEVLKIFEEQKKEQNEEQKQEQKESHNNAVLEGEEEQNKEQNEEQKKVHTSKYNNLSIKSKSNNSAFYEEIINYLNEKMGSKYKPTTKATQKHINARIDEGYSVDDFKTVIDKKCTEWIGTEWEKFLVPETLFGTKFEKYLNQKVSVKPKDIQPDIINDKYSKYKTY